MARLGRGGNVRGVPQAFETVITANTSVPGNVLFNLTMFLKMLKAKC